MDDMVDPHMQILDIVMHFYGGYAIIDQSVDESGSEGSTLQ